MEKKANGFWAIEKLFSRERINQVLHAERLEIGRKGAVLLLVFYRR